MDNLALIPLPVSTIAGLGDPFIVSAETPVRTSPEHAEIVRAAISGRTGLALSGSAGRGAAHAGIDVTLDPERAPESYRLQASATGIQIVAADDAAVFYAAATLAQLLTQTGTAWSVPEVTIDDTPRFRVRGVMLDVVRHFHPVSRVKAFIDRIAALKFNVLHLHLTDDQGWRLQLRSRPALTSVAAGTQLGGGAGGFFTQDDYREIIRYATSRFITVVPEFDMPGHTHAIGVAYPELAEDPVITDDMEVGFVKYGGGLPVKGQPYIGGAVGFSSLRTDDERTYEFVQEVFTELAEITPGPYLHLGGDEALGTDPEQFAAFMERATAIIAGTGKIPVAWHEAGSARQLAPGTIGHYWGFVTPQGDSAERTQTFVQGGGAVIMSPGDAAYLDMKPDADHPLGTDWANGPTSLRRAYEWEPSRIVPGVGESDILGVAAPLWTETVHSQSDIDQLVYPRIAAIAEIAWSPEIGVERNWESFRARVAGRAAQWDAAGIDYYRIGGVDWA